MQHQDVFVEHMVRRRRTAKHNILTVLIIVGVVAITFIAMMFIPFMGQFSMFGFLIIAGVIYGAYHLIRNMSVEYEYLLTNGEMDVDQIIAQSRRKRLISLSLRGIEDIGPYDPDEQANKSYGHKVLAYDSIQSDDLWYLVTNQTDKGKTLVVFNGPERVLNAMKPFLPRQLLQKSFIDRQY